MNKIYFTTSRFRNARCPYMAVLPSDMWRVRQAYEDMRKTGFNPLDARRHVYRLLSTGATSRSSVEIENEVTDERLLQVF